MLLPISAPRFRAASRRWRILPLLAAILLLSFAARPAGAAPLVLYTDIQGEPWVDDPPIPFTATNWFANQFFSFGSPSVISSLDLSMQDVTALGDLQIDLYDNVHDATSGSDQPNAPVASFRNESHVGDLYRFVLTSYPWLDANASYWIVASAKPASTASAVWIWTTLEPSGTDPLDPGQTLTQSNRWATGDGTSWSVSSGSPYKMQIEVTVVPEPSTWAMGAAGVALSCCMKSRRSRRAAAAA